MTCSRCGEACEVRVDGAEGGYMGSSTNRFRRLREDIVAVVSDCCEAEILDGFGNTYTVDDYVDDLEADEADRLYDDFKERNL